MQNNSPLNAQHGKGVAQTIATTTTTTTATPATANVTGTRGTGGVGAGATVHSLSNASTESAPSSPSSTYSSWTVPSLDSLFSVRRASAFGARYGLIPASHASTLIPGRKSPATSSMSLLLEGGAGVASLQSKARKMSAHMSESITSALNDSSLVFYRVNEHIHKKVPQFVEEKKALVAIRKNVETANQDLEDARQTISGIQRITELGAIEALVKRALVAVQK